jgi:GntR family transcriptional regulator / MocR family aminotransferase
LNQDRQTSFRFEGFVAYTAKVNSFMPASTIPFLAWAATIAELVLGLLLFPGTLWTKLANRRLQRLSVNMLLGCGPLGYVPLREAVADYLNTSRGVKCIAEQVVIVSGTQEALDLAARLFLNPGDRVCLEDPGYPGAGMAFAAVGAKVRGIPVDGDGMKLPPVSLRGAKLIYVTPGHQFPLGVTMSLSRRLQLLEWARQSRAAIFEDDYDSEFRYSGRPVPALQGLDRHGVVLFAGSFSKVLFPALRLGYFVLPLDLVDRVAAIKSLTNRHVPTLEQAVLCDFITDGHFGRHLRRMRQLYAERLGVLMEQSRQRLTGLLEISPIEAGLQTTGWLGPGIGAESATRAAADRKVEVIPLSLYSRASMKRPGLQLGFAALDAAEVRRGVEQLAIALEAELNTSRRRRSTL